MIKISVIKNTPCPVRAEDIKKHVSNIFKTHGVKGNAEAEVLIVDEKEMLQFVEKHLGETGQEAKAHPVLSFVQMEIEGTFVFPPDNVLHLGEIIISYPHAQKIARIQDKTDSEAIYELAEHAALHLLGVHHE